MNGRLPGITGDLSQCVFLADANGGAFLFDLGSVQPIASVNSFSWHEFAGDQGARGPQVYTLYASAADKTDPSRLDQWIKIADVDTRPNKTGANWGGQHGVSITEDHGDLGRFRYLLMAVRPTRSPLQPNPVWTNTMFTEVDIHTAQTLPRAGDAIVVKPVRVTDIWVVFKTHFDLGYTDLAANVRYKYRVTMMDIAMKNFEANRALPPNERFVWTMPGWPLAYILGPDQDPARREKIVAAVREGSLVAHAMPASIQTESLDMEDLVRGLVFASRVARAIWPATCRSTRQDDRRSVSFVDSAHVVDPRRCEIPPDRHEFGQPIPALSASVLVGRPRWLAHPLQSDARLRIGPHAANGLAQQQLSGDDHGRR